MKANLEVNAIKLAQKYMDTEVAQQCMKFNKEMLRKLNEQALNRAFQLDRSRT
ncbi:MAG: hypothetical protein HRT53_13005 [Colwellia sp.]|nr:hypothetical protein [Colwellia sp.]